MNTENMLFCFRQLDTIGQMRVNLACSIYGPTHKPAISRQCFSYAKHLFGLLFSRAVNIQINPGNSATNEPRQMSLYRR